MQPPLKVKAREGTTVWNKDGYVDVEAGTVLTVKPRRDDVLAIRCVVETREHRGLRGLVSLDDVGLWPGGPNRPSAETG